jgi:hypothetical protein
MTPETLAELEAYVREAIKAHPDRRKAIEELVDLAGCEIDSGGSEQWECELAYNEIQLLMYPG